MGASFHLMRKSFGLLSVGEGCCSGVIPSALGGQGSQRRRGRGKPLPAYACARADGHKAKLQLEIILNDPRGLWPMKVLYEGHTEKRHGRRRRQAFKDAIATPGGH